MKRNSSQLSRRVLFRVLASMICLISAGEVVGQVMVWGDNTYGETNVPASATNVIALAAGDDHCVALRADGTVVTWGSYYDYPATNVPADLTNAVGIAAGSHHSVALRADGTVTEWGGSEDIMFSLYPNAPSAATNGVALAKGPGQQHVLLLRADGTVVDWGFFASSTNDPIIPPTARNIVQVAAGSYHSVALRSDGTLVAWGNNNGLKPLNPPTGATNIIAIAAGWNGDAALRTDGTILYWGTMDPSLN